MNWGKRLMILLGLFCLVLVCSVYKINSLVRTDLVSKYYEKEATIYQQKIVAKENAGKIKPFKVAKVDPFVIVEIPEEQMHKNLTGVVFFYCVSNADMDKKLQLLTDELGQQMIPQSWIKGKTYIVKLSWTDGLVTFYDEKNLSLK